MWEKYTLFEETTRVPLIIADPRYPKHWGTHYGAPVEVLDVLPTMLDLLGIGVSISIFVCICCVCLMHEIFCIFLLFFFLLAVFAPSAFR